MLSCGVWSCDRVVSCDVVVRYCGDVVVLSCGRVVSGDVVVWLNVNLGVFLNVLVSMLLPAKKVNQREKKS